MTREQCNSCIHRNVCAYKGHLEEIDSLYEPIVIEAGKYPWFKVDIKCTEYRSAQITRGEMK